jgi:hypothetical protein
MLERIPAAKAALPKKHTPTAESLAAAMKAQLPLINDIKKDPQIILSKLTGVDAALRERITSNPQDGFDLALLLILSGRIDEEKIPEGKLPFPLPVPQDVFILAREVGAIWDNETFEDRRRKEILGAFANPSSEESSLFSLRRDTRVSMGTLLEEIRYGAKRSQDLKALSDFKNGRLDLEGLKEYYDKKGLVLLSAELGDDRVILRIGENPVQIPEIEKKLSHLQESMKNQVRLVAKRMSVGFNPIL